MNVQIAPRLGSLKFDEHGYLSFLQGLGVDELSLNTLNVFFVVGDEEDVQDILGDAIAVYCPLGLYVAPIRTFDADQLNYVFLHESRHFLQDVMLLCLKQTIDADGMAIPYEEQPHEVDADAFADECMANGIHLFIGPENVVEVLHNQCAEVFKSWVHKLVSMSL